MSAHPLDRALAGQRLSEADAFALAETADMPTLLAAAATLRDTGFGDTVSYSRKVFIPLTHLCRDVCRYCTFAQAPRRGQDAFLSIEAVLAIARAGRAAGCTEALFTLGDKPERRYRAAREALAVLGHARTIDYLREAAGRVFAETGLMPHLNPGLMDADDLAGLRPVSASMGLMLETASERLSHRGGPHFGSPDKHPARRLETIAQAGAQGVPFTSGLLIGIGETRRERIEAMLALRALHERHGHIQEIIVQNFKAKPGTGMAAAAEPDLADHVWTIAMARLVFGSAMSLQAPPNLAQGTLAALIAAGINDWGGVSPVTPDHVNPEAPWPHLADLARATTAAGKHLVQRLPIYPSHLRDPGRWLDAAFRTPVLQAVDADGFVRDTDWSPGSGAAVPTGHVASSPSKREAPGLFDPLAARGLSYPLAARGLSHPLAARGLSYPLAARGLSHPLAARGLSYPLAARGLSHPLAARGLSHPLAARSLSHPLAARGLGSILAKAQAGRGLDETDILRLFAARGAEVATVCRAADDLRAAISGDTVGYVVTRNINYTNVCSYKCRFCAFSKGKTADTLRGAPYDLGLDEIQRRGREAWARGATEVCMQGGIHPDYTGDTYLEICRAVKAAVPALHVHAFSPLEIWHGAHTLGLPLPDYLGLLRDAGLSSLPGTAAEILDDEVRAVLCADKIDTDQWLAVMEAAHRAGLRSTATIMFGHVERPVHWARHLMRIRDLQARTGGFTEFVPLPFVHMEAPIYLKGQARRGPTFREVLLMHAVARLVLHPHLTNIQASWVKLGVEGIRLVLDAGVNDLGGTLMNETISRAAGAAHGQEMPPAAMESLIRDCGRIPLQRTTLYGEAPGERHAAAFAAAALQAVVNDPVRKRGALAGSSRYSLMGRSLGARD